MSEISDSSSLPPKELEAYRTDFNKGSNLLKEASQDYINATEVHKKKQLEKSMNETIKAMNQILNNVMHENGKKLEEQIKKDYQNFTSHPNAENIEEIEQRCRRCRQCYINFLFLRFDKYFQFLCCKKIYLSFILKTSLAYIYNVYI